MKPQATTTHRVAAEHLFALGPPLRFSSSASPDLGTLGGSYSDASAINNDGKIVGTSWTAQSTINRAYFWDGASMTALGTLGGTGTHSQALDINNAGQIVGASELAEFDYHATLWNGKVATDLNDFLDPATIAAGWVLTQATAINDNGWITGHAYNAVNGQNRGFRLSVVPVPEPETYGLMLAGLSVLAFAIRRRHQPTPPATAKVGGR